MTRFAIVDLAGSDGCEVHGESCSHVKRAEGKTGALRGARIFVAADADAAVAAWRDELRGDFGDDADDFGARVLPCAREEAAS